MPETRFTPGPWCRNSFPRDPFISILTRTHDGDDTPICTVHQRRTVSGDLENAKANANLICAAPDMYDALEAVLESDMAQREEDEGRDSPTLRLVRAALAQARGEDPHAL